MTTLAERKAQAGKHLPRETVTLTFLSGEALFDEIKALTNELQDLRVAEARKSEDQAESEKRTRKGGQKDPAADRMAEIEARIVAISEEHLPEHQEDAVLVGMTSGEWQRWRDAHPPRIVNFREITRPDGSVEQGDPIYHPDDLELTKTPWSNVPSCDASAVDGELLNRLIKKVGAEDLAEGAWSEWLADAILWQDRRSLVRTAVGMHERAMIRLPKAQTSRPTTSGAESSSSPATSESPASDS